MNNLPYSDDWKRRTIARLRRAIHRAFFLVSAKHGVPIENRDAEPFRQAAERILERARRLGWLE